MTGTLDLDLTGVPSGARLYLGISGGLDSAYLAWRLLSLGHPLLLHHCTYKTHQHRWPHEETAYRAVLDWLIDHGLTDWELITTEFSPGGSIPYWFLDYEYLWWIAGCQLRNHPKNQARQDIRHIVIGSHQESANLGSRVLNDAHRVLEIAAKRRITQLHPMRRYNRTQILGDMPRDLLALCWWCRTPHDGRPCHRCNTCQAVDPALRNIGYRLGEGSLNGKE